MSTKDTTAHRPSNPRVSALMIYPLKGAAGFPASEWPVDERGLRHDRRFMLVDDHGQFISQRQLPRLALVTTSIANQLLVIHCRTPETLSSRKDSLTTPSPPATSPPATSLEIPLEHPHGAPVTVRIWEDTLVAHHVSIQADAMFTAFLGVSCKLVWMPNHAERLTARSRGAPQRNFSFADGAPILLATEEALAELNRRLADITMPPVPMDRFRANILVRGGLLHEDDHWSKISINSVNLRGTNCCRRCKVITIDQSTAESQGPEPIRTLSTYRSEGTAVTFGQHFLVDGPGIISVGDALIADCSTPRTHC